MGLLEQQQALLRILVEPRLTEEFFLDPDAFAFELGLSSEDIRVLGGMVLPDVKEYQEAIQGKWIHFGPQGLGMTRRVVGPLMMEQVLAIVRDRPMHRNEWADRVIELEERVIEALEPTDPKREIVRYERALNLLFAQRRAGTAESRRVMREGVSYDLRGLFQPEVFHIDIETIDPDHAVVPPSINGGPRFILLHVSEEDVTIYEIDEATHKAWSKVEAGLGDVLVNDVWDALRQDGLIELSTTALAEEY